MKKTAIMMFLAAALAVFVVPANAALITNETIPMDFKVFVSCANGGAGEFVDFSGPFHLLISETINGKNSLILSSKFRGMSLVLAKALVTLTISLPRQRLFKRYPCKMASLPTFKKTLLGLSVRVQGTTLCFDFKRTLPVMRTALTQWTSSVSAPSVTKRFSR